MSAAPTTAGAGAPGAPAQHELGRRTIGVPALVFMIIAASAPLTVVAGGVTTNFAVTGLLGVPLSFVVLGGLLLLFAVGYSAMSKHIHNAGAFYAYISRGIGKPVGVGAALVALLAYGSMQIGIAGLFGFVLAGYLTAHLGVTLSWWVAALIGWVFVGILGLLQIDLSARVLGVLVALEFLVVAVYDVLALGAAPEGVSVASMMPSELFAPGVGAALCFTIAAFMGFESGAIYNEEVKDPRTTASRATFIAICVIALFYAFSAWTMAVGEGDSAVIGRSQELGPDLMFVFMGQHLPAWTVDVSNLLFITSLFAALVAFHNVVARYVFSLGREGVLPRALSRTSQRGAPVAGSLAQSAVALVTILVFAWAGRGHAAGDLYPVVTLFTWLTNMGAMGLVLLMGLTSVAVIGYLRRHADGYGLWTRVVAPGLGAAGLLTLFVLVLANFDVLIGAEGETTLDWLLPAIVLVPGALGTVWAWWLRSSRPQTYAQIGRGGELD